MRTLVMGDVHGGYKGMIQALERAGFDKDKDTLISLGDIADGWSEVPECVDYLLSCKNLIAIRGNHDKWCHDWFQMGQAPLIWTQQGGQATIDAYIRTGKITEESHKEFFKKQLLYYIDEKNNRAFTHGGYTSPKGLGHEPYEADYYWNRDLFSVALSSHSRNTSLTDKLPRLLRPHKEIFIGHTSTVNWDYSNTLPAPEGSKKGDPIMTPIHACNVWNLDTGGGFYGKITVMDVETKEFWQSDLMKELYPEDKGRG